MTCNQLDTSPLLGADKMRHSEMFSVRALGLSALGGNSAASWDPEHAPFNFKQIYKFAHGHDLRPGSRDLDMINWKVITLVILEYFISFAVQNIGDRKLAFLPPHSQGRKKLLILLAPDL